MIPVNKHGMSGNENDMYEMILTKQPVVDAMRTRGPGEIVVDKWKKVEAISAGTEED